MSADLGGQTYTGLLLADAVAGGLEAVTGFVVGRVGAVFTGHGTVAGGFPPTLPVDEGWAQKFLFCWQIAAAFLSNQVGLRGGGAGCFPHGGVIC